MNTAEGCIWFRLRAADGAVEVDDCFAEPLAVDLEPNATSPSGKHALAHFPSRQPACDNFWAAFRLEHKLLALDRRCRPYGIAANGSPARVRAHENDDLVGAQVPAPDEHGAAHRRSHEVL